MPGRDNETIDYLKIFCCAKTLQALQACVTHLKMAKSLHVFAIIKIYFAEYRPFNLLLGVCLVETLFIEVKERNMHN